MNEGNIEGDKLERDAGLYVFPRALGSFWEVENSSVMSSHIVPVLYRQVPLAAVRAGEEVERVVKRARLMTP